MAKALQRRRGTHEEHQNFTGLVGEFSYDTTEKRIVAHDGVTKGGIPMAKKAELEAVEASVKSSVKSVNGVTADPDGNVSVTIVASATKATQDGNGNVIASTYATIATVNSVSTTATNAATAASNAQTTANAAFPKSSLTYSTTDLTAGTSNLTTGSIYLVYE